MPYVRHSDLTIPPREEKIWRYLDFTKFIAMLETRTLFFSRVDLLGDPFEGSLTKRDYDLREAFINSLPVSEREILRREDLSTEKLRRTFYVNCWHMNDYESQAMWKIYVKSGEGLAIQSSVGRLQDSLSGAIQDIYAGQVSYVNYDDDVIPNSNLFYRVMWKQKSFEYEKELRAIYWRLTRLDRESASPDLRELFDNLPPGFDIVVDLNTLIENIVLSPTSPKWLERLVRTIASRYNIVQPKSSSLSVNPLF